MNDENKPKILDKKSTDALMSKRWAKVVGQSMAIRRLNEIVHSARVDGYVPPTAIISTVGLGKTLILKIFLSLLVDVLGRKVLWFPRGEDCGTRLQLVEQQLVPRFHDHDAVLGIDEVHEWQPKVQSLVRSLIEITVERKPKTVRAIGDAEVTYDPLRNGVVIATNKIEKLDKALLSRFERINLVPYTVSEVETIIQNVVDKRKIKLDRNARLTIAKCFRGNVRDVVQWTDNISAHLNNTGKKVLDNKGALEVIRNRETYPQGVTVEEMKTLLLLENAKRVDSLGEMQLKELAGANNVSSQEQNANETYLRQKQYVRTRGTRSLTNEGQEYLNELRKLKFLPPVADNRKAGKI